MRWNARIRAAVGSLTVSIFAVSAMPGLAQTQVKAPKNGYSIQKDVELGRQAAAEVERQMPMLNDPYVQEYVRRVGQRLTAAIPQQFQHPEFRYSYKVVNVRDLNAFALPGGFTFVNRGMIEASKSEAELAGIMAHEISHVALRHGTAQASKAQKYAMGQIAGQILGAVIGGGAGSVIAQGSQFGIGAYFLKFSREYERQADTLGAQIMANAGYDPRELANVFRTLEQHGGGRGGPGWLSSHPNPGDRYAAINREADLLRVRNPVNNTNEFDRVVARLRDTSRAPTMEEVARSGRRYPTSNSPRRSGGSRASAGEPPSTDFETFRSSDGSFQVGFPSNWNTYSQDGRNVTLAPEWAIEDSEITRGAMVSFLEVGSSYSGRNRLNEALDEIVGQLQRSNNYLREESNARYSGQLAGRQALATFLTGRTNNNYTERVWVIARPSSNGVLYMLFIAPQREFDQYQNTFQSMIRSFTVSSRFDR